MTATIDKELNPLEMLKGQADLLKISYPSNITATTLRSRIMEALVDADDTDGISNKELKELENENLKLVRVMVMPIAQHMRDYEGKIYSVGNSVLPMVTKYVAFNVEYHVPQIILNHILAEERQFFVQRKLANGGTVREPRIGKAYNVEFLEALTKEEIKELARSQENRNAIDK